MKNNCLFLLVLLIFICCGDDELSKQCPSEFNIGFIDIPSVYFDFIPYEGDEVFTFSNEIGKEITFFPKINTLEIKEGVWKMKCAFNSADTIGVQISYDERLVTFCSENNWCIDARTSIAGIWGYCFDIEKENNDGFFQWANVLIRKDGTSLSTENGILQQSKLNEKLSELPYQPDLDSLEINGFIYKDIWTDNYFINQPFSNVIVAKDIGIIQFQDIEGHIWSLKP